MPMKIEGHPTCCGILVLQNFSSLYPESTLGEFKQLVKGGMYIEWKGRPLFRELEREGKVIEVVLNYKQIEALPEVLAAMREFGFKPVYRFNNSTGSVCTVFHYIHEGCVLPIPDDDPAHGLTTENGPETELVADSWGTLAEPAIGSVWRVRGSLSCPNNPSHLRHFFKPNCLVKLAFRTSKGQYVFVLLNPDNGMAEGVETALPQSIHPSQLTYVRAS